MNPDSALSANTLAKSQKKRTIRIQKYATIVEAEVYVNWQEAACLSK
jgi:hypothetical protein